MSLGLDKASIHGRFQPLHLSHLEYIRAAFAQAEFLYVGITQFRVHDLIVVPGSGTHRANPNANPLTYFERAAMISDALDEEGISRGRYTVTPFPIETPSDLPDFLPLDIPILTTRVDEWNDNKVKLLRGLGYVVDVLYDVDPPPRSATLIRDLIVNGDPSWATQVPNAVYRYLTSLDLAPRLKRNDV